MPATGETFPNRFPKVVAGMARVVASGNPILLQHMPILAEQEKVRLRDIKIVSELDDDNDENHNIYRGLY
jgi:hypothetical protein